MGTPETSVLDSIITGPEDRESGVNLVSPASFERAQGEVLALAGTVKALTLANTNISDADAKKKAGQLVAAEKAARHDIATHDRLSK